MVRPHAPELSRSAATGHAFGHSQPSTSNPLSRHICFRCACGREEFAASARFTTLFWDDALQILKSQGVDNPFRFLPDDTEVEGGAFSGWWETAIERLAAAQEALPMLYEIWRARADGESWGSDAGYFRWRGEVHGVESVYNELVVWKLDATEWEARSRWVPYSPPVLEAVAPAVAPIPRADRRGEPMYNLSAADFEQLFRDTPLRLERGVFLEFFRPEIEEARSAARHAAEAGERVVLYTY